MLYLILVSLLWAASPSLIKTYLSGTHALPSDAIGSVRLAISLLVFLPFLTLRHLTLRSAFALIAIGAIQFGLMYQLYLRSFAYLKAYEVALFTILTPLFVIVCEGCFARRLHATHLAAALLAVVGGGILSWNTEHRPDFNTGFWLLQGSGLCFAFGQVAYRRLRLSDAVHGKIPEHHHFALLYFGAVILTAATSARTVAWENFHPSLTQWLVLALLGALSSGLGFFAWNLGATRVNPGTLAAFNNLKIPLMIGVSVLIFGETFDATKLLLGSVFLVAAITLGQRHASQASKS